MGLWSLFREEATFVHESEFLNSVSSCLYVVMNRKGT